MFFQPFSLRNYRELVEEIHDVIYKIDKNKKIVFINSAVEDLTGYTKDELVDKNFLDFIYHEDRETTEAEFDNLFIKGQCDPVEYRIVRKDKSTIWVRSQSKVLKIKGKFVGIQGVLIDINQLKEQNQELSDFSYRVSHDLRNSFITIQNFSELIKEKPNFSDEFHGYIIETCQNSLEYIDQLLKLASSGELIKEKEEIDISCLIKSLYFQYKNKFELNCDTGIIIYKELLLEKMVKEAQDLAWQ